MLPVLALGCWVGCGDFGEEPFAGPPPDVDGGGGVAGPDSVRLVASLDNTLFEPAAAQLSNGAGAHIYAGTNLSGQARRALLEFPIATSIPAGATIERVELDLLVTMAHDAAPRSFSLHRALKRWGEGTSDAGSGGPSHGGGSGAAATPGDATWTCAVLDTDPWATPGGDFVAQASATALIAGLGPTSWASTAGLVDDVRAWLDDPASNFGWILVGDESGPGTALRFDSRENSGMPGRPMLTVTYTPPPTP